MNKYFKLVKKYKMSPEDSKFMDDVYMALTAIEERNSQNEAILDGSWPTAWAWLQRGMELVLIKEQEDEKNKTP